MSMHKIFTELRESFDCPLSGAMALNPATGGYMFAWGTTVPADGATGYSFGCIFIHVDGTNQTNALYTNIGSATSANFNAITVAAD
jgi:hypothetical protein